MALPHHKITETVHAARADQEIQRWISCGKQMRLDRRSGDALGVRIGGLIWIRDIRILHRVWVERRARGNGVVKLSSWHLNPRG